MAWNTRRWCGTFSLEFVKPLNFEQNHLDFPDFLDFSVLFYMHIVNIYFCSVMIYRNYILWVVYHYSTTKFFNKLQRLARGSMVPRYLLIYLRYAIKETDHTYVLFFYLILHYVAILSAEKLSDFFHPLIHQREMTAGHYSECIKGRLLWYGSNSYNECMVCCRQ